MPATPNRHTAAREARLAEYARLRDSGVERFDAGIQLGVCDKTREGYERWYRSQRGLPRLGPNPFLGGLAYHAGSPG